MRRVRHTRNWLLTTAGLLAAFCGPAPTAQAGRASLVQLESGYALERALGELHHGGAIGGRFYLGLSDFVMIGGAARFDVAASSGVVLQGFVGGSALLRLDVLQWVPFATLDVGAVVAGWPRGGPDTAVDLEVAVGLGVDYLVRRGLAVGASVRYHVHATDAGRYPAMLTVAGHIGWRFE